MPRMWQKVVDLKRKVKRLEDMSQVELCDAMRDVLKVYSYVYQDHSTECRCCLCRLNEAAK